MASASDGEVGDASKGSKSSSAESQIQQQRGTEYTIRGYVKSDASPSTTGFEIHGENETKISRSFFWSDKVYEQFHRGEIEELKTTLIKTFFATRAYALQHHTMPHNADIYTMDLTGTVRKQEGDEAMEIALICFVHWGNVAPKMSDFSYGRPGSTKKCKSSFVFLSLDYSEIDAAHTNIFVYAFISAATGNLQIVGTPAAPRAKEYIIAHVKHVSLDTALCGWCGVRSNALLVCGGCKEIKYCGPDCQRNHRENGHRKCRTVMAAMMGGGV